MTTLNRITDHRTCICYHHKLDKTLYYLSLPEEIIIAVIIPLRKDIKLLISSEVDHSNNNNSNQSLLEKETKSLINSIRTSSWKMGFYKPISANNSNNKTCPCRDNNNSNSNSLHSNLLTHLELGQLTATTSATNIYCFLYMDQTRRNFHLRRLVARIEVHLPRLIHFLILSKLNSSKYVISAMSMRMSKQASPRLSVRNTEMSCSSMVQIMRKTIF